MVLKFHNKVRILLRIPGKQPEKTVFFDKFPSSSNLITFVHFIFSTKCNLNRGNLIGPRTVRFCLIFLCEIRFSTENIRIDSFVLHLKVDYPCFPCMVIFSGEMDRRLLSRSGFGGDC